MAVVRKKQDDKNLKILRELVTSGGSGGNRQCFDCGQKGPTYVNMTIGSFVCTRCSGVLRGLTPPHRVKSISMATFTPEEIEFLKTHGNDICAKTWLGLWDPKRIIHQDQRELMIDKYERKRYYLEPASPLKSLTNAAKVPSINGIVNGSTNSQNNSIKHPTENNFKNIALTPPTSLRLSSNNNSVNSNSNSNRQQHRYNFQNQFTPEENGFFDSTTAATLTSSNRQNQLQNNNNNNINNHVNGSSTSQLVNGQNTITNNLNSRQVINKNSLNISSSSDSSFTSNKFTPDTDFIADFGSANIFNAIGGSDGGGNTTNPLNGFKVHQNGTAGTNHVHTNNFVNGSSSSTSMNGSTTNLSNANANFADFDHAPIYNAAVYQFNNTNNNDNNNFFNNTLNYNKESYINSDNSYNISSVQPTNNLFNNNNGISYNSPHWSIWQQFQSPFSTPCSEQNRWSLPMSLNSTSNSLSSSATFTSNSSINSTPPADRYAALKDLDEQLREIKTTVNDSFSTQAPAAVSPNPFKHSPTATQPQQIGNPFQISLNQPTNIFASNQQLQSVTNAFGASPPFTTQSIMNYNNGFSGQPAMVTNGINNGCGGLGYGTQQVAASGNAITNMKNPFAASSLSNSNNPFL